MLRSGLSSKSVGNVLILLGRIFKKSTPDYVRVSPLDAVELPRTSGKKAGRALKPEEIRALLEALEGDPDARLMVMTAILSGLRQAEQFGLMWTDVDFESDVIHVRRALYWRFGKAFEGDRWQFTEPKTKNSRRDVDLSPGLKKELLAYRLRCEDKSGLVFQSAKGTPLVPQNVYRREFLPAVKRASIEGAVRWHDLRLTFGSLKLDQGESLYYVQRQLGHSSIDVTVDIYGHPLEERRPEAAQRTSAVLFGS